MFDRLFTPPRDEKSLITAAKHDHRAFAELYERFVDVVYRFVRGQVSTRQDAEDIISETFVAVAHQIGGYDISREQKFTTRLLAIAKYKLLDSLRKVYTTPEMIEFTELNEPGTDDNFLDLLDHRHLYDQILAAAERLPVQQSRIFLLRYADDLTNNEIAELCDLDPKTISSVLSQACKRVRTAVGYQI